MYHPIFHSLPLLVSLILVLGICAWWSVLPQNRRKSWLLVLPRWVLLLLLLWILARPSATQTETESYPGSVLILADSSRSMEVADCPEKKSRFEAQKNALTQSAPELARMSRNVETEVFAFDRTLHSMKLKPNGKIGFPKAPAGDETALGAALLEVLRKTSGKKVLGIALLSDGAQRALPPRDALPQTAASRMSRLGIPLFVVPFGSDRQEDQAPDAVLEDFLVDQRVFVNTEVAVTGRIRLDGLAKTPVPVELLVETPSGTMEIAGETTIQAEAPGETVPVQLSWTPKEPGEVKVTLRVPPQAGEASILNNQLDAFVTVSKSGLRVLYLEGAFRPETGFLRRALDSASEIQLDLVRLNDPNISNASQTGASAKIPNLSELLNEEYAVVILGDVSAANFRPDDLELLAQKVHDGTGLLTLGGLRNYGPGGFASSPLAGLLPVVLEPPKEPTALAQAHWNLPVRFHLTPAGRHHTALALDAQSSRSDQIWAKLPPLDGANRFTEVKPGAKVLASDFTPENQEIPLLVEQTSGRGRVMTLAVDSTWRWQLGGYGEAHKRFWRQLIFWLANRDATLDGTVSLILPQRRFPQEQKIEFQVSARLSNGVTPQPPETDTPQENWTATLEWPDGKRQVIPLTPENSLMKGQIPENLPEGDYMLSAAVVHQGQKLGETRCRFQVYRHDLELDHAQAEPELLTSLAQITGGERVEPADLGKLWNRLAASREELKIERKLELPLWDRWWWLAVILSLLCFEWFWRKHRGLP